MVERDTVSRRLSLFLLSYADDASRGRFENAAKALIVMSPKVPEILHRTTIVSLIGVMEKQWEK